MLQNGGFSGTKLYGSKRNDGMPKSVGSFCGLALETFAKTFRVLKRAVRMSGRTAAR